MPDTASTPGFELVEVETLWIWRWPKERDVGYYYRAVSMDQGDDALIAYLRRGIDTNIAVDAPRKCGKTMLFELVARHHYEAARFLVEQGADLLWSAIPFRGPTPLSQALSNALDSARIGSLPFLAWALSHLHSNKAHGSTRLLRALNGEQGRDIARRMPLLVQASLDHGDSGHIVSMLVRFGGDPNLAFVAESTPLHFAAARGLVNVAAALLASGARVNAATRSGLTPLHMAARVHCEEMCSLLIAHGADPSASMCLDSPHFGPRAIRGATPAAMIDADRVPIMTAQLARHIQRQPEGICLPSLDFEELHARDSTEQLRFLRECLVLIRRANAGLELASRIFKRRVNRLTHREYLIKSRRDGLARMRSYRRYARPRAH